MGRWSLKHLNCTLLTTSPDHCLIGYPVSVVVPEDLLWAYSPQLSFGGLRMAFPDWDEETVDRVAQEAWESVGRTAGELPHLPKIDPYAGDRVEVGRRCWQCSGQRFRRE